jgi:hypothetical protein
MFLYWTNVWKIEQYDYPLLRRYVSLFPDTPLAKFIIAYFEMSDIPVGEEDDDEKNNNKKPLDSNEMEDKFFDLLVSHHPTPPSALVASQSKSRIDVTCRISSTICQTPSWPTASWQNYTSNMKTSKMQSKQQNLVLSLPSGLNHRLVKLYRSKLEMFLFSSTYLLIDISIALAKH